MSRSPRSTGRAAGRSSARRAKSPVIGPLQYGIIALTVATALIHFILAFDITFILNGLGYLVLLGALYLPLPFLAPYRGYVRWALMLYAAVTIVLWAVITGASYSLIGYLTKAIELALIVLLWLESRQEKGE